MIAQINGLIPAGVGVAILGVYVWVSCHIANRKRHPNAESIVYEDFCKESQKRIDDRHDASEKRADERHKDLKEDIGELKNLVIANGKK